MGYACRVPATVFDAGSSGVGCAVGSDPLRGRDRQAQQMVDVVPKEAIHEQKFGLVNPIVIVDRSDISFAESIKQSDVKCKNLPP